MNRSGFLINTSKHSFKIVNGSEIEVTENNGEIGFEIIQDQSHHDIKSLSDYIKNVEYTPDEISIGITAPKCNLNCPYCLRHSGEFYNFECTTKESLEKYLSLTKEAGLKCGVSFFSNEFFIPSNLNWHKEIFTTLDNYKDVVKSIMIFTNGVDLLSTYYPVIDWLELNYPNNKHLITLAVSLCDTDKNTHLNVKSDKLYEIIEKLNEPIIRGNLTVKLLLQGDKNLLEQEYIDKFFSVYKGKISNLSLTVGVDIDEDILKQNIIDVMKVSERYDLIIPNRIVGLYSYYSNNVPIDLDGVPRYAILDKDTLYCSTSGKQYNINKTDIKDIVSTYIECSIPKLKQCDCTNCHDIVKSGQCKIEVSERCLSCQLFGACSGFYKSVGRVCDLEVYSTLVGFSILCSSISKITNSTEEAKELFEKRILVNQYKKWFSEQFNENN